MGPRAAASHDWNVLHGASPLRRQFTLLDETLRDGIQSPSVSDPPTKKKIEFLHRMAALGIGCANIGLPGAGRRAKRDAVALAREIQRAKLKIIPTCAARTVVRDIEPIVDVALAAGRPIEVYAFIGTSPYRMRAERWQLDTLLANIENATTFATRQGLPVCLVTEDTTRTPPAILLPLFRAAMALGVRRLCLCDTVGYATPDGIKNLFAWIRASLGTDILLDWHGHNDRGLAVSNALFAIEYGANRVHGTGLGVGERVGNTALDQLLVNLSLVGAWAHDLSGLPAYCALVAHMCGIDIPANYPIVGRDAFRTATGVHAAAIIKAQAQGEAGLADCVYSSVPAQLVGRHQEIEIGPMSGLSNVRYWLAKNQLPADEALANDILAHAKSARRVLSQKQLRLMVRRFMKRASAHSVAKMSHERASR